MIKKITKFFRLILILILIVIIGAWGISYLVSKDQKENIIYRFQDYDQKIGYPYNNKMQDYDVDAIIVLGAGIYEDGTPSPMLKDRLEAALKLYYADICKTILVSGDNGTQEYNEVKTMCKYLTQRGVPKENVFIDYAGFSTYDSMYRAQSIFQIKKAIVVTQSYHQYRALFIGNNLGIKCYGVSADQNRYGGQLFRSIREILARDKDVFKTFVKARPTYGGDEIPISGNANPLQ